MRAIVQNGYGSADVLHLREIETPTPAGRDVRIRVRAAGLNHADWALMRGEPYLLRLAFGLRTPKTPVRGRDLAGVVDAVGPEVTRFRPGDEVYAEVETGTFAEFVIAPEGLLAPKPSSLTFEEAAAVPLAANTALQGLRDVGRVQPGQQVLINGASGGVGTFAVQIGKAFGAEVTGVCSTRNVDRIRSLGADHVIDYTREDFVRLSRRFDLIFDLAGNRSLGECRRALTPRGTLVLSSGAGSRTFGPMGRILRASALSPFVRQTLKPLLAKPNAEDLATLTKLIEAGTITPAVERTYPLEATPDALRAFETEHARAKIVITMGSRSDRAPRADARDRS